MARVREPETRPCPEEGCPHTITSPDGDGDWEPCAGMHYPCMSCGRLNDNRDGDDRCEACTLDRWIMAAEALGGDR